jgi:phosphohistidine phosphatase SixA
MVDETAAAVVDETAAVDAKAAEEKAAEEKAAKEKAELQALTEWVAKAMLVSHQDDNPMPLEQLDPTPAMTSAREFVAAFKAMGTYKSEDPQSEDKVAPHSA